MTRLGPCCGCVAGTPLPEDIFSSLAPSDDTLGGAPAGPAAPQALDSAMEAFDPFGTAPQQPTRVPPSAMHASMVAASGGNGLSAPSPPLSASSHQGPSSHPAPLSADFLSFEVKFDAQGADHLAPANRPALGAAGEQQELGGEASADPFNLALQSADQSSSQPPDSAGWTMF